MRARQITYYHWGVALSSYRLGSEPYDVTNDVVGLQGF